MTNEDLKKIREMMGFLVKDKISRMMAKNPENQQKLYDLTKKDVNVRELVKLTGISAGKISKLWQKWEKEGVLIKEGQKYRKIT